VARLIDSENSDESRVEDAASGGVEKRQYVRSVFQQIAPSYDLLNHLLSLNIDRMWRRRAIATLGWTRQPEGIYLDLCAGTMDVGAELVGTRAFRGHVVAVDFADAMLRAGRHKCDRQVMSPVVGDAMRLPLANGSVDGAVVAFGARNLADLDSGLREVHRVLAKDGRFVILEFTTPRSRVVRAMYHAYFHHVLPILGGAISGHRTAYRYLPLSVAHFPAPDEISRRLRRAGFSGVGFETLSLGIAAIHTGVRT
jgi:demethylmenaquinone methyltransferase/2-methoxy-6-polyprenyl-1,4-benzoquinol methylase